MKNFFNYIIELIVYWIIFITVIVGGFSFILSVFYSN